MQTYDSYKNSGIDWLGEIPSHWEVKKLKYFGYIYSGLSGKKGDDFNKEFFEGAKEFVPFTTICNYSQINEERFQFVKVLESEYQNIVVKNDLLFLMSSETLEDIGKSSVYLLNKQAYLNSFCKGFRIQRENLNSVFANYLLNSLTYRKYFELCGRGFTRINIKQEYINDANISIPPIAEQEAIAAFLDEKCGKIDELVSVKEQQIALLKERRQVVIHEAVTKGIQPNVEMKHSGIDWIGEIPSHWEVKRLKNILKAQGRIGFKGYSTTDLVDKNEGALVLGASHLDWDGNIILKEPVYLSWKKYYESPEIMVNKGDIIIVQRGSTCGKVAPIIEDFGLVTINPSLVLLKSISINNIYCYFSIKCSIGYIFTLLSKTAIPMISQEQINNIFIPVPPISEQEAIVAYLEEQTGKINQTIALKTEQIENLKAYKQSLINEVVTGKVRVA